MTAEILTLVRELDERVSNGIQVRLLWCEPDDTVWVVVVDTRSGDTFRLDVAPGERPLDVFEHPYAYAAARGIEPRPADGAAGAATPAV
jgi:hypothetical protein